jgi:hypothetical protein
MCDVSAIGSNTVFRRLAVIIVTIFSETEDESTANSRNVAYINSLYLKQCTISNSVSVMNKPLLRTFKEPEHILAFHKHDNSLL